MMSLGTDFEMHAIWQGYVEDPTAKDFVARKARTIALSKVGGTRQSTLFISSEIPWGFHTQAVLRSLAGLMSCRKVSVQGFLWVRKVWFAFAQRTFASETFGKRQKRLALRNQRGLCQKYGGACTTYYLVVPKVWEMGQEIGFPCCQERARRNK
jgi:hypothetical protein